MVDWVKNVIYAIHERKGFFMFLRAQFSSQLASVIDILITILLGVILNIYYVYATFFGSVFGGIINCIINYKWTFKSQGIKKCHIAAKYAIVWTGSIFFNTYGTYLMTESLNKVVWLESFLGSFSDDVFVLCKIIVSLVVGFLWNYNMQRLFVYKAGNFKKHFSKK